MKTRQQKEGYYMYQKKIVSSIMRKVYGISNSLVMLHAKYVEYAQ